MHSGECKNDLFNCISGVTFDRYDFDSWREFSYLDEENLESAQRFNTCLNHRNYCGRVADAIVCGERTGDERISSISISLQS